jgi:hypothetical protein
VNFYVRLENPSLPDLDERYDIVVKKTAYERKPLDMKFIFTSGKDTKVYYCWSIIVIVRVGNNIRQNFPFAMRVGIQPSGGKTPLILKFDTSLE